MSRCMSLGLAKLIVYKSKNYCTNSPWIGCLDIKSNLGLTQQQAMFPDYYPFIQPGQVKRDVVNTGFPKESNGDTGCKESHFYLQLATRAS